MNNKIVVALSLLGLSAAVAAEPQWPQDAVDEQDPRVIAFYNQRCAQWTDESQLQNQAREAFHANCMASAPQLWPVGFEPDSGN